MIDKNDIVNIAKHVVKRGKGIPDRRIMHANRDWFIGVLLSVGVLVAAVLYAGYSYVEVQKVVNSDDVVPEVSVGVARYEEKKVNQALEWYITREAQFDTLRHDRSNTASNEEDDEDETSEESVSESEEVSNDSENSAPKGAPGLTDG